MGGVHELFELHVGVGRCATGKGTGGMGQGNQHGFHQHTVYGVNGSAVDNQGILRAVHHPVSASTLPETMNGWVYTAPAVL